VERAGLPVENAVLHTRRDRDPDGLLGQREGYHSKVTFEDRRIDRGTVAVADPGSIQLGGAIEMFPDADAARTRAERLHTFAPRSPVHAEYAYLNGRILLRVSTYLSESAADSYAAVIEAAALARPTAGPITRDV
jgi:hypothetical protein